MPPKIIADQDFDDDDFEDIPHAGPADYRRIPPSFQQTFQNLDSLEARVLAKDCYDIIFRSSNQPHIGNGTEHPPIPWVRHNRSCRLDPTRRYDDPSGSILKVAEAFTILNIDACLLDGLSPGDYSSPPPLHTAARQGYLGVVKVLLTLGADINILFREPAVEVNTKQAKKPRRRRSTRPVPASCKFSSPHFICEASTQGICKTALDFAIDGCNEDVAIFLVREGIDMLTSPWKQLAAAAQRNLFSAVQTILERNGIYDMMFTEQEDRDIVADALRSASGGDPKRDGMNTDTIVFLLQRQYDTRIDPSAISYALSQGCPANARILWDFQLNKDWRPSASCLRQLLSNAQSAVSSAQTKTVPNIRQKVKVMSEKIKNAEHLIAQEDAAMLEAGQEMVVISRRNEPKAYKYKETRELTEEQIERFRKEEVEQTKAEVTVLKTEMDWWRKKVEGLTKMKQQMFAKATEYGYIREKRT